MATTIVGGSIGAYITVNHREIQLPLSSITYFRLVTQPNEDLTNGVAEVKLNNGDTATTANIQALMSISHFRAGDYYIAKDKLLYSYDSSYENRLYKKVEETVYCLNSGQSIKITKVKE